MSDWNLSDEGIHIDAEEDNELDRVMYPKDKVKEAIRLLKESANQGGEINIENVDKIFGDKLI